MSRHIQIELLDPVVLPGEEFSVNVIEGNDEVINYFYFIIDVRTRAIVVQSGVLEESTWEASLPVAGQYQVKVEATMADGRIVKGTEVLQVSKVYQ